MKGQEEAPFEILLGMIIFSFVLMIANYLLEDYQSTQVETKLEMELTNLKNYMEDIAFKAVGTKRTTSLDFTVPSKIGSTTLTYITLERISSVQCPGSYNSCWAIVIHAKNNYNKNGFEFKKIYTQVPGSINIDAVIVNNNKKYSCSSGECLKLTKYLVTIEKIKDDEMKISFN